MFNRKLRIVFQL